VNQPSTPLRVLELAEWKTTFLEGVSLTEADKKLAAELMSGEDGRLTVEELRTGVRVNAHSWIGVIRFENFEVRVVPKLAGGNLKLVEMIEFTTGLDALRPNSGARSLQTEGSNLFDLIALLFAEECERLVRGGLLSDYVECEDLLPVVRGRLLGDRQILQRFGQVDRLICRFDEQAQDIPDNQLLAAALNLCAKRVEHPSVRLRVGRMRNIFEEVCTPDLNLETARQQITYHRLNEHYREAHTLAWLILEGLNAVKDLLASGRTRCFAFLLDMNQLFERFVYRLISGLLTGSPYQVSYQRADRSIIWNANTNLPYSRVIPDLLVRAKETPSGCLAIDAKYKLYDERKISPADVYQSFLYAYAYQQGGQGGHVGVLPISMIVYPSSLQAIGSVRLRIQSAKKLAAAEILAMGIFIPDLLDEIRGISPPSATKVMREAIESRFSK
jgi:5-methylcytosine-specific restriction enzyme subunit McrC